MKRLSFGLCSFLAAFLSANASAGVQDPQTAADTVLVNDLGTYRGRQS